MDFVHNRELGRYEAWVDGELAGETDYELDDAVADFNHTGVPPQFGGQGIASALVSFAMDDVRATGEWKVRPTCSYVAGWFAKHPDYADLLTDESA